MDDDTEMKKRNLNQLHACDLGRQLNNRGLSQNGSKAEPVLPLKEQMELSDEGLELVLFDGEETEDSLGKRWCGCWTNRCNNHSSKKKGCSNNYSNKHKICSSNYSKNSGNNFKIENNRCSNSYLQQQTQKNENLDLINKLGVYIQKKGSLTNRKNLMKKLRIWIRRSAVRGKEGTP